MRAYAVLAVVILLVAICFYARSVSSVADSQRTTYQIALDIRSDQTVKFVGGWGTDDIANSLEAYASFVQISMLAVALLLCGVGLAMIYKGIYLRRAAILLQSRASP